jgi:hypothetical protein
MLRSIGFQDAKHITSPKKKIQGRVGILKISYFVKDLVACILLPLSSDNHLSGGP